MMLPCILAAMIEDEAFAKEFWITAIMIRPGARKSMKGMPLTLPRNLPIARVNIAKNTNVVITGARIV